MILFEDIFRNFGNLFNILPSDIIYEISFELPLRYIYELMDEVSLSREDIQNYIMRRASHRHNKLYNRYRGSTVNRNKIHTSKPTERSIEKYLDLIDNMEQSYYEEDTLREKYRIVSTFPRIISRSKIYLVPIYSQMIRKDERLKFTEAPDGELLDYVLGFNITSKSLLSYLGEDIDQIKRGDIIVFEEYIGGDKYVNYDRGKVSYDGETFISFASDDGEEYYYPIEIEVIVEFPLQYWYESFDNPDYNMTIPFSYWQNLETGKIFVSDIRTFTGTDQRYIVVNEQYILLENNFAYGNEALGELKNIGWFEIFNTSTLNDKGLPKNITYNGKLITLTIDNVLSIPDFWVPYL